MPRPACVSFRNFRVELRSMVQRLLILEADGGSAQVADHLPGERRFTCERARWPWTNDRSLEQFDLVVAVAGAEAAPALDLFRWLRAQKVVRPALAVLPDTGSPRVLSAAAETADDFVFWPLRRGELGERLRRMLPRNHEVVDSVRRRLSEELSLGQLVGRHPDFLKVLGRIPLVASSDAPALLLGETGTGKELCARAIHHLSGRRGFPFIPVECGALPDHLAENELFGHARGAYTDAHGDQKGLVGMAQGGTLFLDEIDALSLATQAKLLRFLQEGTYRPLGSERFLQAGVRIVAASNRDLRSLVREKELRADLYFRLSVLELKLPPLRERREDIAILARHFLESAARTAGDRPKSLSSGALRALEAYDWPGNVRELANVIARVVVFSSGHEILSSHLPLHGSQGGAEGPSGTFRDARRQAVETFERFYVTNMLSRHGGNITHAARESGKERRAFGRLVKKYGLHRDLL
jgi:two-component system, NtrC family, response regulator GlrR